MAGEMNQLIRILKIFVPKALRWWKKRQAQQQQQQGGGGGGYQGGQQQQHYGGQQQHQSYSGAAGGGAYGPPPPQQQQQYGGGNMSYGQPSYGSSPPPMGSYGPQSASYEAPHKPSLAYGNADHFGAHAGHVNQDMINASDANYTRLRNDAIREGDLMHQAFDKAHNAHERGDGAAAKQFSDEGHRHQQQQIALNRQASDWIFNTNNQRSPPGTIDLHGLYVKEAIERTERAVQDGQRQGATQLRVITGKGLHSAQHVAKIKPAIEDLMQKYGLAAHIDPHNTGVLIVDLQGGRQGGGSRDLGFADQLAAQADGDKCTIM